MIRKAVLLGLAGLVLGLPAEAEAARPERISIDISESFTNPFWTEQCGTEVVITVSGREKVKLWRNADGLIVRQHRRAPGTKITYSAAETGNSYSYPDARVLTFDYGDGAQVGSEVILRERGLGGRATGFIAADAGSHTFVGEVTGFDDLGIPEVDLSNEPIKQTGRRNAFEDVVAATCEALTGATLNPSSPAARRQGQGHPGESQPRTPVGGPRAQSRP
jgi:hypothetical protein